MNVILIVFDSLRSDAVYTLPGETTHAPNLARFCDESVCMMRAFCGAPETTASRWSWLTGTYAFTRETSPVLSDGAWTFLNDLNRHKIQTALIGDTPAFFCKEHQLTRDFRDVISIPGQFGGSFSAGIERLRLPEAILQLNGASEEETHAWLQYANSIDLQNLALRPPARVVEQSLDWLKNRPQPFFLWVDMHNPHEPWDPPKDMLRRCEPDYDGLPIPLPKYSTAQSYTREQLNHIRRRYLTSVKMSDYYFGKLWHGITRMGLHEDTAVIVLSDHGAPLGEHEVVRRGLPCPFPELLNVPFIIHLPEAFAKNRQVASPVQTLDITPTLLSLFGLPVPDHLEGSSLLPILRGEDTAPRETAYFGSFIGNDADAMLGLATSAWHFVQFGTPSGMELYQTGDDPGHFQDVAESFPHEVEGFQKQLGAFLTAHAPDDVLDLSIFSFLTHME